MPRGAAVIRYPGKRGVVWRIKYRDADGRQVQETLGPESDGWNKKGAGEVLQDRLSDVRRKGLRRPRQLRFAAYAETWFAEGETKRGWKPSTKAEYRSLKQRLIDHFGPRPLAGIRPRHIAEYVHEASKTLGASTVGRDVDLLHAIFQSARREELVESNPAEAVERPKLPRRRWRILEPTEIGEVARAFTDEPARVVFLTLLLTGLRRSELQALRWRDVDLVGNVLRVRDSKSEDGIRSIAIPPKLAEELWQHRRRSSYQGEGELVFCHPERGTIYRAETFKEALAAALKAAGVHAPGMRAFHDLRHSAITNDAASGSSAIAVMTKAGHSDMRTTKTYLHLAGTVFRDEAHALENRLLGGTKLYPSELTSDDLAGSEPAEHAASGLT